MIFGIERLLQDLKDIGFANAESISDSNSAQFGVLKNFEVPVGRFAGRIIDLAIPAPADYGRNVGSAIHVRSSPHLLDKPDSIPGVKNIVESALGSDWRYWSHRFIYQPEETTQRLMYQINSVFRYA
jgi:hypothetical protein